MKISDMKRMLDRCRSVYDTDRAYICVSWRSGEYHPIEDIDGSTVIVGTDKLTNLNGLGPTQYFPKSRPYRVGEFYGTTMTFDRFSAHWMLGCDESTEEIEFLIATTSEYPKNIIGDINPHLAHMVENWDGTRIVVLSWDKRDSGDGPRNEDEMKFAKLTSYKYDEQCFLNEDSSVGERVAGENLEKGLAFP